MNYPINYPINDLRSLSRCPTYAPDAMNYPRSFICPRWTPFSDTVGLERVDRHHKVDPQDVISWFLKPMNYRYLCHKP